MLNLEQVYTALRMALELLEDDSKSYYYPYKEKEYIRDTLREVEQHLNELDNSKDA